MTSRHSPPAAARRARGWRQLGSAARLAALLPLLSACGGGSGGAETGLAISWITTPAPVQRDAFASLAQPPMRASLSVQNASGRFWLNYRHDASQTAVSHDFRADGKGVVFDIQFINVPQGVVGTYADTLTVRICEDEACTREAAGSPTRLPVQLAVGHFARAEAGVTPLVPRQTTVLNHNVVAAAYSASLDAVVTVSALPTPVLRVHELASGLTRSVALATAPTALSVSPDGLQAAVGHDRTVSLVQLPAGSTTPLRSLAVPQRVGALSLTGPRVVVFDGPSTSGGSSVHSVDLLTDVVTTLGTPPHPPVQVHGVQALALHPAGDRLYLADVGLSPEDILRLDLGTAPATATLTDSPYHGEHRFCGRLALAPDGQRLYTGCGVQLSAASNPADDLHYLGQLPMSADEPISHDTYRAPALSVAPDNRSVAMLEHRWQACETRLDGLSDCHTRLAVHDTATLARRSLLGLGPYVRGSDSLQQFGRHLLHRRDGSLILLAEVRTGAVATPTWLMHQVGP